MQGIRVIVGLALLTGAVYVMPAVATEPSATDPMSRSKGGDNKPQSGHSTFDAPDKNPGMHGEIAGGGGPSGPNDGAGQKAPQFEGEKHKSVQQSERDAKSKPGGKDAHQ